MVVAQKTQAGKPACALHFSIGSEACDELTEGSEAFFVPLIYAGIFKDLAEDFTDLLLENLFYVSFKKVYLNILF